MDEWGDVGKFGAKNPKLNFDHQDQNKPWIKP